MSVCCGCCVLSRRGACDELITRPEESYPLWCVVVCDLETSCMRRPWPTWGGGAIAPNKKKLYSSPHASSLTNILPVAEKTFNERHGRAAGIPGSNPEPETGILTVSRGPFNPYT